MYKIYFVFPVIPLGFGIVDIEAHIRGHPGWLDGAQVDAGNFSPGILVCHFALGISFFVLVTSLTAGDTRVEHDVVEKEMEGGFIFN